MLISKFKPNNHHWANSFFIYFSTTYMSGELFTEKQDQGLYRSDMDRVIVENIKKYNGDKKVICVEIS